MRRKLRQAWLLLWLLPVGAAAQEHTTSNMVGIGGSAILDTYISQEKFSGLGVSFLNIREQHKTGRRWGSIIEHEVDLSKTDDRSKTVGELEGCYNLYWGRYRQWRLLDDRLRLQAGGLMNATLGFIYDMSGSNNPAQARAALLLMPAAVGNYDFPLLGQSFTLRYELNVPLAGLMFSPNYGQSYYEIFSLGNYDHNLAPTTFVSAPCFRQLLTLDWKAGKQWDLRIGYLGNYQQAQVNNLKQHVYTSRFMIGIVKKWRREK